MQTTGRLHDARHFSGLERKCSLLKGLLHVSFSKVAQVTALASTAAVGLGDSQLGQCLLLRLDDLLVVYLDDLSGLGLGAGDFVLRGLGKRNTSAHHVHAALLGPSYWALALPRAAVDLTQPYSSPNHARLIGQLALGAESGPGDALSHPQFARSPLASLLFLEYLQNTYRFPARGPSGLVVFYQQVSGADLTLAAPASTVRGTSRGAVVLCHVDLELVGIGSWWGLPAAVAVGRVEVVWKVLGLAVAHLPVGREAGLGLVVENERHVMLAFG